MDEVFSGLTTELPSRTFFDELYERFARADTWRVFDDVKPTLKALHERGIRLAVLSNWDERFRPLLEELELGQWFEEVYISLEIGWAKPDERIFEVAAKGLGLSGDEILHVGDSLKEDGVVGIPKHPTSCSASTTNLADRVQNSTMRAMAAISDGLGMGEIGCF